MSTRTWLFSRFKTNFLSREDMIVLILMMVLFVEAGLMFYLYGMLIHFIDAAVTFSKGIRFIGSPSPARIVRIVGFDYMIASIVHFFVQVMCCLYFVYSFMLPILFLCRHKLKFSRLLTSPYLVAAVAITGIPLIWYGDATLTVWWS